MISLTRGMASSMGQTRLTTGSVLAILLPVVMAMTSCSPAPRGPVEGKGVAWAYPISQPPKTPLAPPDKVAPLRLEGTSVTFTAAELKDLFAAPDWRPTAHPPMPPIVASGRKPDVMACGFCHLPTGGGRPENASLAGLPREYIIEQMRAFRSGARRSSVAGRLPTTLMEKLGKAATDVEIEAAAAYFSALPYQGLTRVLETATVPRVRTNGWVYSRDPAGGREPIGARILEITEDFERFEKRDPATTYLAYVPMGSVARGAELARTWGGGGQACAVCHGPDLRGSGSAPPLAGRSPTYIARQLNDFRTGARHTQTGEAMRSVASSMRDRDIIALAAFLGSRRS